MCQDALLVLSLAVTQVHHVIVQASMSLRTVPRALSFYNLRHCRTVLLLTPRSPPIEFLISLIFDYCQHCLLPSALTIKISSASCLTLVQYIDSQTDPGQRELNGGLEPLHQGDMGLNARYSPFTATTASKAQTPSPCA